MIPGVPKQITVKRVGKKRLRSKSRSKAKVSQNQTPRHFDAETDTAVHSRETTGDSVSIQSPDLMGVQFFAPCV